jgi:hypothetical protein
MTTKRVAFPRVVFVLAIIQLVYFALVDWERSFRSPFSEIDMMQGGDSSKNNGTKKVVIENNRERYKMIVYREHGDGGIQGILMDFYIDEESGQIANEFLRIHEREDGEIELIKIE